MGYNRGMKIAVFTDLFLEVSGGIPSSIKAQKAGLEALGHQVVVFCPGWKKSLDKTVIVLPTCKYFRPGGAPFARNHKVIEKWVVQNYPELAEYDLVHVHYEGGASLAGARLARKLGLPLVQTMHGREDMAVEYNAPIGLKTATACLLSWAHARGIKHEKTVQKDAFLAPTLARAKMWELMVGQANFADAVITPTEHFAEKLRHYGVKKLIFPVSNGVADSLAEGEWPLRVRSEGEPLRLFWSSRLSKEKRIVPFLQALQEAQIDFRLDVYGDGNQMKEAKKIVRRTGMKVKFYGAVAHEKILEQMKTQHLSVMASYGFDTQGLTLLESVAVGMPVLYCDPDMDEVVPRGGGVRAKSPDPKDMAEALRAVATRPEWIQEMSQVMLKNSAKVLQSAQIEKLLSVYKKLI